MFKLISGLTLGLNVALATAQTYEGFIYQTNNPLTVNYADADASWSAGDRLSTDETTAPPQVGFPYGRGGTSEASGKELVLIMLDSDSHSANGSTSTLNLLHSGLKADQELTQTDDYLFYPITSKKAPEIKYVAPAPGQGAPGVHNYTLLVFEHPEGGFTLPEEYEGYAPQDRSYRTGFVLEQFVEDTGLGEPFAATYFTEKA